MLQRAKSANPPNIKPLDIRLSVHLVFRHRKPAERRRPLSQQTEDIHNPLHGLEEALDQSDHHHGEVSISFTSATTITHQLAQAYSRTSQLGYPWSKLWKDTKIDLEGRLMLYRIWCRKLPIGEHRTDGIPMCPTCGLQPETYQHLFTECSLAMSVAQSWVFILCTIGNMNLNSLPNSLHPIHQHTLSPKGDLAADVDPIWNVFITAHIQTIWYERNQNAHDHDPRPLYLVKGNWRNHTIVLLKRIVTYDPKLNRELRQTCTRYLSYLENLSQEDMQNLGSARALVEAGIKWPQGIG
jgi:hypothetical protein